jgi:hypothetical protein
LSKSYNSTKAKKPSRKYIRNGFFVIFFVIIHGVPEYSLLNAGEELIPERSVPLQIGDPAGPGTFRIGETIYYVNTKRGWRHVV